MDNEQKKDHIFETDARMCLQFFVPEFQGSRLSSHFHTGLSAISVHLSRAR